MNARTRRTPATRISSHAASTACRPLSARLPPTLSRLSRPGGIPILFRASRLPLRLAHGQVPPSAGRLHEPGPRADLGPASAAVTPRPWTVKTRNHLSRAISLEADRSRTGHGRRTTRRGTTCCGPGCCGTAVPDGAAAADALQRAAERSAGSAPGPAISATPSRTEAGLPAPAAAWRPPPATGLWRSLLGAHSQFRDAAGRRPPRIRPCGPACPRGRRSGSRPMACDGRRVAPTYQTPQARVVRPACRRRRMPRLDATRAHGRSP